MPQPLTARDILDREFLEVRAKLLQVAATLDRLERAEDSVADDPRSSKLRAAMELLLAPGDDHARQLQLIFSQPYDPAWRSKYFSSAS